MKLTGEYISDYIDKKIEENEQIIKISFYELNVKEKLTKEQIDTFLELSQIRLREHLGYHIYKTGQTYTINGVKEHIENNLYYVAIKER